MLFLKASRRGRGRKGRATTVVCAKNDEVVHLNTRGDGYFLCIPSLISLCFCCIFIKRKRDPLVLLVVLSLQVFETQKKTKRLSCLLTRPNKSVGRSYIEAIPTTARSELFWTRLTLSLSNATAPFSKGIALSLPQPPFCPLPSSSLSLLLPSLFLLLFVCVSFMLPRFFFSICSSLSVCWLSAWRAATTTTPPPSAPRRRSARRFCSGR